ncbi:GTP cyclohydrolase I [Amnibacterium flavum]|uniref:GTP cyclohydrolase I n=1 Tax=Amnibacterium flavum TaxID=2173173 RepID=UPI001F0B9D3E
MGELLAAIGEDSTRDGLRETPDHVAAAYAELFSGVGVDAAAYLDEASDVLDLTVGAEPVILRDIPFRSTCEHHLLPFEGTVSLAYLPRARVTGLGRLARVVDAVASRPQIQERLTEEIADAIHRGLDADGALVIVTASHACLWARGSRTRGASVVTIAGRGEYSSGEGRRDVLPLLTGSSEAAG